MNPPPQPSPSSTAGPPYSLPVTLDNDPRLPATANGTPLSLPNEMQLATYAAAQQRMGPLDPMMASGLQPNLMMSMDMLGDGSLAMDAGLAGSDQFAGMTATGPPTGAPMAGEYPSMGGGSILTEFTKRRNWSQRILEELQDFLHILTPEGRIVYASPSCKALTGFGAEELMNRFILDFIHPDDSILFTRDFHESIATGRTLRMFYRFKKSDDTFCIFETHGHPHIADAPQIDLSAAQSVCKGFFMMARPYPTRNAALLDSFLEHKMENERLVRKISELRAEEQQEQLERQRHQSGSATPAGSVQAPGPGAFSGNNTPMSSATQATPSTDSMPPPAKPVSALTRQNLDRMEASGAARIEGMRDKMARYDGASRVEHLEMLTGLRFGEGERSKGLSTGDTSPALIRGDVGVPIPIDKENRQSSDKKKKPKIADEYVCTDCGTLDSPEWRKGPKGPKTLCNACGLRWAKKEKKRTQTTANGAAASTAAATSGSNVGG